MRMRSSPRVQRKALIGELTGDFPAARARAAELERARPRARAMAEALLDRGLASVRSVSGGQTLRKGFRGAARIGGGIC
jgi:hypothetical protein